MSLEADVLDTRRQLTDATRARIRAEAERDAAQQRVTELAVLLAEQFGVTTIAEAEALHAQLTAEVEQELAAVTAALDAAGV